MTKPRSTLPLAARLAVALLGSAVSVGLSRRIATPLRRPIETARPPPLDLPGAGIEAVAAGRDSAGHQASEQALQESEQRFRSLFKTMLKAQEIAKLGSWELDIPGATLSWSPEAFRIFEQEPGRFAPSYGALLAAIHPDDRPGVERAYWDSLARRAPYDMVHRLLLPGGRIKWVHDRCESEFDPAGRPLKSHGIVQDITAHKLAELAVIEREAMLDELLALATRFVNVPDQGLEDLMGQTIGRVGRFVRVDGSFVCRLDEAAGTLASLVRWSADGAPAPHGQAIALAELPVLVARLRAGESIAIDRVGDLPAHWSREREHFAALGIRSLLAVPLALGDTLHGLVGLHSVGRARDWSAVELHFLRVFASILSGAMDRARATAALRASIALHRLAQERIEESEERLASIYDNAPIGMALVGPDLRFNRVNRAMATLLGRTPEELIGMGVDAVTHPDDLELDIARFAELNAGLRTSYRMTKRYLRPDGSLVWGDLRASILPGRPGEPPMPLGMVEDVTELHAANQRQLALEEALTRYTAQLEELVDLVNLPLAPADQIRALLRLGCRGLGVGTAVLGLVDEAHGHRLLIGLRDDDPDGVMPELGRTLLAETLAQPRTPCVIAPGRLPHAARAAGFASCIAMAYERPRPDGRIETLVLSLWGTGPTLDLGAPERQIIRLVAQRIASVHYQEQAQQDLVAAKERETIGHLASGVAHDFNNLLGVIDANIFYLDANLGELGAAGPEIRQVMEETQSALGQAKVITSGMLSLSRAGGVPLERTDLGPTVAELERILRQILPPGIELRVAVPPGLAAWTNGAFLQSALLNLALNARDAMPEGGVLIIQGEPIRWEAHAAPLAVGRLPSMHCVDLSVVDTGTGIAPGVLARIFDPLFSTKAKQRGHGLGLFMVQEFVVRSGAGLAVESEPGVGTRFRLLMPRQAAASELGADLGAELGTDLGADLGKVPATGPAESASTPDLGVPSAGGAAFRPLAGLRVLVVDDDPRVREAVARVLALDGAGLGQAEHGQACLELLERDSAFDLVLSDIAMPTLDGVGLRLRLAELHPGLPVILMTGQEDALAAPAGPDGRPLVLHKPVDPATLRAAILTALSTWPDGGR